MGPGGATINAIRSEVGCVLRFVKMRRAAASSSLRAARSSSPRCSRGWGRRWRRPPAPPRGVPRGASMAPRGTRKTPEPGVAGAAARRRPTRPAGASPPLAPPVVPAPAPPAPPPPPSPSRRRPRPNREYLLTVAPRDAQVLLGLPGLKEEARRAGVRLQRGRTTTDAHLTLRGSAAAIAAAKARSSRC